MPITNITQNYVHIKAPKGNFNTRFCNTVILLSSSPPPIPPPPPPLTPNILIIRGKTVDIFTHWTDHPQKQNRPLPTVHISTVIKSRLVFVSGGDCPHTVWRLHHSLLWKWKKVHWWPWSVLMQTFLQSEWASPEILFLWLALPVSEIILQGRIFKPF